MYLNKDPELLSQDDELKLEPAPKPKFIKKIDSIDEISWNFSDSILPLKALAAKAISDHQIRTQRCFADDLAKWAPRLGKIFNWFYHVDENFESLPLCYEEYIRREPWNNVPVFIYYYTGVNSVTLYQETVSAVEFNEAAKADEIQKVYVRRTFRLSKDNQETLVLMNKLKSEINEILNAGEDVYLPASQAPFQGTDFIQAFY